MSTTKTLPLGTSFRTTSPAFFGLGLLCIILLIASTAYFAVREAKHHLYERASISTHNVVNLLDLAISSNLNKIASNLNDLALDWKESINQELPELLRQQLIRHATSPELSDIGLINSEEVLLFSKINYKSKNTSQEHPPLQKMQKPDSSPQLDGPFLNIEQEWVMRLSQAVYNNQGSFLGFLYAQIPLKRFQEVLNETRLGAHGAATVRTASLALVARNPTPPNTELGGTKTSVQLKEAIHQNPKVGEFIAVTAVDGIERINVYRRLQNYPLYVLAGLSIDDLAPEHKTLVNPVLILAALAIIFIILGGVILYRSGQRLSEQEVLFRRFFEQNGLVMLILDARSGKILAANQEAVRFYGYQKSTFSCMHINELNDKPNNEIDFTSPKLKQPQIINLKHKLALGESKDVEIYCSPATYRGYRKLFLIIHDITDHKKTLMHLKETTQAAEAASRAKSIFVANMSHEIRTPMNAVLGLLNLMHYTKLTEIQCDYLSKAETAAKSLLTILNDILDFSKVEEGKLNLENTAFSLDELLLNLSIISSSAIQNKPIELLFDIDSKIPTTLIGDMLRLQQILLNLIGNSIKFTERGEIYFQARLISLTPDKAHIEWRVCDTGIGIPADRLDSIFEGFTQAENSTTRRYGGTGLGLAISRHLVALMGGVLKVKSTQNQGSFFWFDLALKHTANPVPHPSISSKILSSSLYTLIIDTHSNTRTVLSKNLSDLGSSVLTADSGLKAIELVQGFDHIINLILIDQNLPDTSSQDLIKLLRQQWVTKASKIVLMTSYQNYSDFSKSSTPQESQNEIIIKPITPANLRDLIRNPHKKTIEKEWHSYSNQNALAGLKLLLVEDNILNQQVAKALLTHAGATVEIANNGLEAVKAIQNNNQVNFDAVLMDLQMPEMDGYEATRLMRSEGFSQPIIAMTANALTSDRVACLAAGMNDHIGKPIDSNTLINTLLKHCSFAINTSLNKEKSNNTQYKPLTDSSINFDLKTALERLGNDEQLFISLINEFATEQPKLISRAQQALELGKKTEAARELHTLKGLLFSIGSITLAEAVKNLESMIKSAAIEAYQEQEEFSKLRASLEDGLTTLQGLIKNLESNTNQSLEESSESPESMFIELQKLVSEHNMRAISLYSKLQSFIRELSKEEATNLDKAIHQLDFDTAHSILKNLQDAGK